MQTDKMSGMIFALLVGDEQSFNDGRLTVTPIGLKQRRRVLLCLDYT